MDQKKRIALYGGTFDPVHLGHLAVARTISELFEIDQLVFVPAQLAPHKVGRPATPALHRHAMLALATQDEPRMLISTLELEAPAGRYTVDTLTDFKARFGNWADLFFIMGADSWNEITSWYDWERLLALANHIVVSRPGYELSNELLTAPLAARVVDLREVASAKTALEGASDRIFITDAVMMDVSASRVRRAVGQSSPELATMVPPVVADYINKYGLYREANER